MTINLTLKNEKMNYIIILNPNRSTAELVTDMHGFLDVYNDYESAEKFAKEIIESNDATDYAIYELVTS